MKDNGERVLDVAFGLSSERREVEAHFLAHSVSDHAWQPNAIAQIMQFDGYFGIH